MPKILVNGYGTIGKRIAWAIKKSSDLELYGIVKTKPDYSAIIALKNNIDIYVPSTEYMKSFEERGIKVKGTIEDALSKVDIVVDATPAKVGAKYKELYLKYGVKAIFQGGEKHDIVDVSFNSLCNYEEAFGRNYVRVVSCNTTGLLRIICSLHQNVGVRKVRALIVRRGADPKEIKRGPINSIVLDPPHLPSHHGVDVKTVLPWLDIETAAVVVPTTLMHMHHLVIELEKELAKQDILRILEETPRILLVDSDKLGIRSTSELIEIARDAGRLRNDFPEILVWSTTINVRGRELVLIQSIHQESIVIPENIDAIRAVLRLEEDKWKSIEKTDRELNIGHGWLL